jgi:thiamine kinase-like enzyme
MGLEEDIKRILQKRKGSVLIVDDKCDIDNPAIQDSYSYKTHCYNETELNEFLLRQGINVNIVDVSHKAVGQEGNIRWRSVEDALRINSSDSVILVSSNVEPVLNLQVVDVIKPLCVVRKIQEIFPSAKIYYFIPQYEHEVINRALDKVLKTLVSPDLARLMVPLSSETYPTLMHYVSFLIRGEAEGLDGAKAKSEQHQYKGSMWKDKYLPYIDASLRAGNSQTSMDYHFLVLSNSEMKLLGENEPEAEEKVKIRRSNYVLDAEDLAKCAAIFIDNEWNSLLDHSVIGKGIEVLRRVRSQLDAQGISMPIIYQSGHDLSRFSPDEINTIESLGAVLATKDVFPKVCSGKSISDKEHEMSDLLQHDPILSRYSVRIYDFGKASSARGNMFVLCSRIIEGENAADSSKLELFSRLKIDDSLYNHRMYVLSALHSGFKQQTSNKKLEPTSRDFYDYASLRNTLSEFIVDLESIISKEDYEAIVTSHRQEYVRKQSENNLVLTHNDAKWDNWFNGLVLGDFGSAQAGMEYKDVAKALMNMDDDFDVLRDRASADRLIDNYLKIRQSMDRSFNTDKNDFRLKVYEMIITECLRTMFYKADNRRLTDSLSNIARMYSSILQKKEYS